ncbi:hypothetical protein BDR22DRAFT_830642 [Usnea florida]
MSVPRASSISAASASASAIEASISSPSATSASAASALRASSVSAASASAASLPSQISSNKQGSSLCKSLGGNAACISAFSSYNPLYNYTHYTSYVHTTGGFKGEWLGWGCAAMFTCDSDTAYAKGMTGQQILNAFWNLYNMDGIGVCGSTYLENGCHLTVNACDMCEGTIPCDALPVQDQPPHGGVPCYYDDGTTWPPAPEVPGAGGREQDMRDGD